MALISNIEKRTAKARMIYLAIYLFLGIGSITMIYPLMIMLSNSVSSDVDYEQYNLFPRYLFNNDLLWRKYLGLKYDREIKEFRNRYRMEKHVGHFRSYKGKYDEAYLTSGRIKQVRDWHEFKKGLSLDKLDVFFTDKYRMGPLQIKYQDWLAKKYNTIQKYNLSFHPPLSFRYFNDIEYQLENLIGHNWPPLKTVQKDVWLEFKKTLDVNEFRAMSITHTFQNFLKVKYMTIEKLNRSLHTSYKSFYNVDFFTKPPGNPRLRRIWKEFVRTFYPMRYARVPGDYTKQFKRYILGLKEFRGKPTTFNRVRMGRQKDSKYQDYFRELKWTERIPQDDMLARLWTGFVDTLPLGNVEYYHMHGAYRKFLVKKYEDVEGINQVYDTGYVSKTSILPPYKADDLYHFKKNRGKYKGYFLFSNYIKVMKYIFINGYALKNTLILVFLWVLANLTVQPMAAYALSRYKLKYANKILIFLIATMAFPHSVGMIPRFLLLKNLGLLNTYAALVLPHVVQGMGIFLLKGYFDSLPREYYESAMIDGASEFQIFFRITLPLSKPILAVIALRSFTAAYGSFMWAFLICQKESMWTLMVFLYQFQQSAPQYTYMAALVIAAIPTLIVFIFAQRIIMRGIVVPTMK